MKYFSCRQLGEGECDWEFTGRNENEVLEAALQHARDEHDLKENEVANLRNQIRPLIQDRQAA